MTNVEGTVYIATTQMTKSEGTVDTATTELNNTESVLTQLQQTVSHA